MFTLQYLHIEVSIGMYEVGETSTNYLQLPFSFFKDLTHSGSSTMKTEWNLSEPKHDTRMISNEIIVALMAHYAISLFSFLFLQNS
jgi:hypothetical protein